MDYQIFEADDVALTADVAFADGWYKTKPEKGLRAMARVYAGWGFPQAFYRAELDIKGWAIPRWRIISSALGGSSWSGTPTTC